MTAVALVLLIGGSCLFAAERLLSLILPDATNNTDQQ